MIRVLLVDDEQPARERLRQLLAAHADVEVAGEAEDGVQALEQITALTPDAVFLDIQMPGASGLDVAGSLAATGPAVIFCTAFDQHAVDAFELSAIDYLLKPVTRARLASALDRVRRQLGAPSTNDLDAGGTAARSLSPARFLARRGARLRVVPGADVVAFTFDEGITRLVTATEQLTMQPTLAALARRLDAAHYFQVSRTVIVRLDAVREARPAGDGTGEIVLSNGKAVAVTRRRWRDLIDKLGG